MQCNDAKKLSGLARSTLLGPTVSALGMGELGERTSQREEASYDGANERQHFIVDHNKGRQNAIE
jgi:hypothetical protein